MQTRRTITREEEALHELGTTVVTRRAAILVTLGFLACLALPLALQPFVSRLPKLWVPPRTGIKDDRPPPEPTAVSEIRSLIRKKRWLRAGARAWAALDDEAMREIEKQAIARTIFPRLIQPLTQRLLYKLGRGTDDVYIGRNDTLVYARDAWLLWRQEEPDGRSHENAHGVEAAAKATVAFRDQLRRLGIPLIVLPVPPGIGFAPEMISDSPVRAPVDSAEYREYVDRVEQSGIEVIDLVSMYERRRAEGPMFLRRNTHWSGLGVRVAAEAVVERVKALHLPGFDGRSNDTCTLIPAPRFVGSDLMPVMRLPAREASRTELTTVYTTWLNGSGVVPTKSGEVFVVGDSFLEFYSAGAEDPIGGFTEHLGCGLRSSVDRVFVRGGGATVVRQVVASDPQRLAGKRLVVWEFAARDLAYAEWLPVAL